MHNKKRILGIVGACLFALLITLLLPGTATAAQNVENTYAVVVTTGNSAGENVAKHLLSATFTSSSTSITLPLILWKVTLFFIALYTRVLCSFSVSVTSDDTKGVLRAGTFEKSIVMLCLYEYAISNLILFEIS